MLTLKSQLSATRQKHKKSDSSDTLNSQRKRRFLSVVSSEAINPNPPILFLRKISELKKQTMGEITNRAEQPRGIKLRIKRNSEILQKPAQKSVGQRMWLFKKKLANLVDVQECLAFKQNQVPSAHTGSHKLQTPINRLLFESTFQQNSN